MKITRAATAERKATRSPRSAQENAFEKAWNKVIKQQQKNASLRQEVQEFSLQVSNAIAEHETSCLRSIALTCEHLLSFSGRKSLNFRQRGLLLDWIAEYLAIIDTSPFSKRLDLQALRQTVEEQTDQWYLEQAERNGIPPGSAAGDPDDEGTDDRFADQFDEFEAETDFNDEDPEPCEEDLFGGFDPHQGAAEARRAEAQALQDMMKASSINRLFRKLARVLHPDRERDDDARKTKNRLMGELLQARRNNDIPAIFSLYAEHVGESPLQELADDLDGVTRLLQRRYEELRDQQDMIIEEEPIAATLYRRFHRKSKPAVQRAIRAYQDELQERSRLFQQLCRELSNVNTLKHYLAQRRKVFGHDEYLPFEF